MRVAPTMVSAVLLAAAVAAAGCGTGADRDRTRAVTTGFFAALDAHRGDGESVFLGAMREGWRIQALGCRPRSSGLYDCEEQA